MSPKGTGKEKMEIRRMSMAVSIAILAGVAIWSIFFIWGTLVTPDLTYLAPVGSVAFNWWLVQAILTGVFITGSVVAIAELAK